MNMLKTLYGSFHSDKAIAELDKLGVSVYKIGEDGTKQFRKAQDVMLDLSVAAQGTNQSLEETYKAASGGKFQWSKAGATLGDYKAFIKTWGEAVNSMGFTDKQVEMQLDTISRRLQTLKTDMLSLSVAGGNAGITGALKDTISVVDNFVTGLKEIPAWSVEAAAGLGIAAKAFIVLKNAIVATNVASLASRATPLGLALTALAGITMLATEAIGSHANAQREANRQTTDAIALAQQQEQQTEKQAEFADALMGAHQKLQEQINGSTQGTEKYNKAVANQQETEVQLTRVLGEAAVQRIKDKDWSVEAYNKEKEAFENGVAAKKVALKKMVDDRIKALEIEKSTIETSIKNYWADVDNFKRSIWAKADALSWYQKIMAGFYGNQASAAQDQADKAQVQMDELREKINSYEGSIDTGEGKVMRDQYYRLYDLREKHLAQAEEYKSSEQKIFESGAAEREQKRIDVDKEIMSLHEKALTLSEIPSGLKTVTEPGETAKGSKTMPTDRSEEIQKKLDNYNVKSIEDQAAIAQDNYKARLDSITAATDRYGKSYEFLNDTTDTMNDRVKSLQATTAALNEQLTSDLEKVNELASSTGATIEISGGANTGNAEGSTWTRETSGVNIEGLHQQATDAISAVSQKFYELTGKQMVVSSGLRDWGGHTNGTKFDVVDDASSTLLENNANGIRDAIISYAREVGLEVADEYTNPSANATAGHLDFDAAGFTGGTSSQQVSVSIPQEVLASAGITQEAWKGMSAESKKEFISNNKEQIKDAQLLVGYLTQISGEQKKIAEYQKQITEERKKEYETLVKGIKDIENYQVKQAELSNRTSLASLGYYATDADKAVAAQQLTKQKLAASNAALEYAKKRGIDIFTDPEMSEERVKNLELQQQLQQESTFATPEARYKQRMSEIEYQQKLTLAGVKGNSTSPYNAQLISITNLEAAQEKVKALDQLLKDMKASDTFADQTNEFKQYNLQLQEAIKNANELADTYSNKMKQGMYDVTNELLLQGKKISDIWGDLWKQLANDALKALMGIKNDSPGLLAQALGKFGGATKKQENTADTAALLGTAMKQYGNFNPSSKESDKYSFQYGGLLNSLSNSLSSKTVDTGVGGGFSGFFSNQRNTNVNTGSSSGGGTAWGSILGSLVGLFHANGGIVDSPAIAGEDGEEVIIPVEKNKGNSANLLSYAAGKLGQKTGGLTADFSSKDIAKTAMSVSVNSATNMAKTNGILATQNQILTTMLNNMGKQQGQTNVIVAGGNNSPTIDDFSSMYNTAVSRRSISNT